MTGSRVRLSSVANVVREGIDPRHVVPGTRYVGLEHISGDGSFSDAAKIEASELASTKFAFTDKHVLFGKLRPYLRKTVRPNFSGICSTDIIPIAPSKDLDRDYLFHFLRTDEVVGLATSMASGANLPRISPKHLIDFEIPLPPLDEQRRIAAILDQADALRRKRRETLGHLRSLSGTLFISKFGDLVANERKWPAGQISDLVAGFESGKSLVADDVESTVSPYRVLKISAVTSLRFQPSASKALPENYEVPEHHFVRFGDLLFSRANTAELIGATAYVDVPCDGLALPDKLWRFCWHNAEESYPLFIWQLFMQRSLRDQIQRRATGTSGSMKNISQGKVLGIEVGIPDPKLQRSFSEQFAAIREAERQSEKHLAHLDALFASLQHRAFRGEL
ncbi:MAG: restriction endonuclease subunit S [bacterium]|nr:restriction endonuclease subunit S [bacterium]